MILYPGESYSWLLVELTDEANLHHKVDGACHSLHSLIGHI